MAKAEDIQFKLGEMHGDIKSILAEAKRTNGRVTKIEDETVPELKKEISDINLRLAKYVGIVSAVIFLVQLLGRGLIEKL